MLFAGWQQSVQLNFTASKMALPWLIPPLSCYKKSTGVCNHYSLKRPPRNRRLPPTPGKGPMFVAGSPNRLQSVTEKTNSSDCRVLFAPQTLEPCNCQEIGSPLVSQLAPKRAIGIDADRHGALGPERSRPDTRKAGKGDCQRICAVVRKIEGQRPANTFGLARQGIFW